MEMMCENKNDLNRTQAQDLLMITLGLSAVSVLK